MRALALICILIVALLLSPLCAQGQAYDWQRAVVSTAASFAIDAAVTYSLKPIVRSERPDGSNSRSFPSGHTSLAFTGASVLYKETHHITPWIGVAGYAMATGIAIERVHSRHHRWGDVLAGAGIGVLSTEVGYWATRKLMPRNHRCDVAVRANGLYVALRL